jgi:ribonuclease VapC
MSAVNIAEFVAKLVERSFGPTEVDRALQRLPIEIVAFDRVQARAAGLLRERTMHLGLSLGDRACLALALAEGLPVLTADRAWARLDVGVRVELIR